MCCGKKRRALALGALSAAGSPSAGADQAPKAESLGISAPEMDLLYLRQSPIQLRGNVTGRLYQFSSSQRVQTVNQHDAAIFLRTPGLFRPTK